MKNLRFNFEKDVPEKLKVMYGILTPCDWDETEHPTSYSLYTLDENDIPLRSSHLRRKMLKLVNKPVEVIGEVEKDEFGDDRIIVKKIRRLRYPVFEFLAAKQPKKFFAAESYSIAPAVI